MVATSVVLVIGLTLGSGEATAADAGSAPSSCAVTMDPGAGCATLGPPGKPFRPGANCRVLSIDGFPRQYVVYLPARPQAAAPVVFMHHGSGGNGYQFLNISGWAEKADQVGLVAVFPTALEGFVLDERRCSTKWHMYGLEREIDLSVKPRLLAPDGSVLQAYPADAPWPADDVTFERAMLADVSAGLEVDPERVYVSGFSNGAAFTARLAIEMSDSFAAAAWSGGGLPDPAVAGLPPIPQRHIPVAMDFGECDDRVMEGISADFDQDACLRGAGNGIPLDPTALLTLPAMAARIGRHLDAFDVAPQPRQTVAARTATCLAWRTPTAGNPDGRSYRFSVLKGVTHQYPRCDQIRCNNPAGFSAADRFWSFFSGHTGCP